MTAIAIFGLATITMAQVPSYVPTNGLVGYWPFNGNANDESGNGNNGTVNGATLTTDRLGTANCAYNFDGINDFIIANSNPLYVSDILTISIWINTNISPPIISNYTVFELGGTGGSGVRWACIAEPGNAVMAIGRGCTGLGNAPISTSYNSGWSNFIFVVSGLNQSIFYNGNLIGNSTNSQITSLSCSIANLYFGVSQWSSSFYFTGKLDDIGIWNRALSPCEIQALYQSGTSSMTVNATASTICSGLSTTLTASGATTYSWMPGSLSGNSVVVSPSTTTTYTITGTDGSGCTSSTTALVNVSIPPSTATSQTNISCNGGSNGSATIAVSGGAPGYSYLWNNGQITATLSGLTAGTYTCTVTDANSCSTITAVTLSEPAAIAGIQSPAICVGDNYPVGSSTYTASGTYTDILTATNGCDSTVTTNLTVNPLPSLAVAATDTNVCVYSSAVSLIAIPTGGTWSGAGIIGSTFSPAIAGAGTTVITYAYSDGNACSNTANIAMLVDLCTGINKFKNNTSFTVYPSPVSDELIIEMQGNKNNTGFEIVNPIGQVIFNGNLLEKTVVQTSNFAPGVYLIKLKNGKSYEFKKIVKE